eukprot:s8591_g2.t1
MCQRAVQGDKKEEEKRRRATRASRETKEIAERERREVDQTYSAVICQDQREANVRTYSEDADTPGGTRQTRSSVDVHEPQHTRAQSAFT